MGYFLFISKCERDFPGGAWKCYDRSLRKKVADCPGQADPCLWLTSMSPPTSGPKSNIALKKEACVQCNLCKCAQCNFCNINLCSYRHVCKVCSGASHKASNCPIQSTNDRRMQSPFTLTFTQKEA